MFKRKQIPTSATTRFARPAATRRQANLEACEPRRMYDATPSYSVSGTEGNDTITINITKNANGKYDVATGLNGKGTSYSNVKPGYLNVYAKGGNDNITVYGQFDDMPKQTVYGDGGKDTLTLKAFGTRSLDQRMPNGLVFQGGSETDKLILDSSLQPVQKGIEMSYEINDRKINVVRLTSEPKVPVQFTSADVEKQEVLLGGYSNIVSVPRNVLKTNVLGSIGYDSVYVGKGLTDAVQGQLYVDGGGGIYDLLAFDETARTSDHTYKLYANEFIANDFSSVAFSNMDNVQLDGGKGDSTVQVNAVASGTRLDLNGSGGDDQFLFWGGDYDTIKASQVVLNGGGGNNHVLIGDAYDTEKRGYEVSDSKIKRTGSGDVKMTDIDSVELRTGRGESQVGVSMSTATSFDVRDDYQPTNHAEDRIYVFNGNANASPPELTGIGEGTYSAAGKKDVAFDHFERFTGDDNIGGSISGYVFNDNNGNGKFDGDDHGMMTVPVYIDANHNNQFDAGERQAVAKESGLFEFAGLAAGTYYIGQRQDYGWRQTTPADGGSLKVVVAAHGETADRYLGATRSGKVSGTVFVDKNKDNTRDGNEYGDSGWRVYDDADNDGKFDPTELSTLTASNGLYTLSGLAADRSHRLRVAPVAGHTPYFPGGKWVYTPAGGVYAHFDFSLLKNG